VRAVTDPGRLIGEGRDSLVYDLGDGRVLRRYRRPKDTTVEARLMTWAGAHGVPVPHVFDAAGADLVMERIDGRAALAGLESHPWRVVGVGRLLAALHRRLDAVPTAAWMPERGADGDVRPGVVHCDLHPDNVMLTGDGPVLIDWTRAGAGDRRMDLAHTWLILAELGFPDDRLGRAVHTLARRALLDVFLRRVDRDGAAAWLARVAEDRQRDPNTTAPERRRLTRYATVTATP
jgi:aminoglycoside phosphotransferase (APT) family kinase protein